MTLIDVVKKTSTNIIEKFQMIDFVNRVLIPEYEWGLQHKNGQLMYLASNKINWVIRLPWEDCDIYFIDKRMFDINFNISPYLSSHRLEITGTAYVIVSDPMHLILNVQNPTDASISERIKNAISMAMTSIMSTLNLIQVQQTDNVLKNSNMSNVMDTIGISPQYFTINDTKLPPEVETAFHNVAVTEYARTSITNIAQALGKVNPIVGQQVLQWENKGSNFSDLLGILLMENLTNRISHNSENFSHASKRIENGNKDNNVDDEIDKMWGNY